MNIEPFVINNTNTPLLQEEKSAIEVFLSKHFYKLVFLLLIILLIALVFINGMAVYNQGNFIG